MIGKILIYNVDTQMGIIRAEDGKRYDFIAAEVRSGQNTITQGSEVDFMLDEQGNPLEIYVVQAIPTQQYIQHPAQPAMHTNPAYIQPSGTLQTSWIGILFSLEGCITVKQFWTAYLGIFLYYVIAYFIADATFVPVASDVSDNALFGLGSLYNSGVEASNAAMRMSHIYGMLWKASLPVIWVYIALSVKRFHDANYSGAMWFINFIPGIGQFIVFIINGFVGSVRTGNRFCQHVGAAINTSQTQPQGYNVSAPSSAHGTTSSHSAETKVVEEEKPSLQLAPWFVTLLFGPAAFVLLSILYVPIGENMFTFKYFLRDIHGIKDITNFSNIYLFLLAIGATYVASQKFDITLKYTTIKAAKMKDDSGKEQKIGFLSLEPEAAFLLMMPTLMVMLLCIGEGFRYEVYAFIGDYYFFKTILLAPIGLAVYMLAMNKPVVFIAMGDENNSKENKYTAFKSWTSAMLLTPGITMLIIFMINYFGLENIIYDNSEIMITVILLVMMLIIAAIINQIITLKRLQPIAKVKNDDK